MPDPDPNPFDAGLPMVAGPSPRKPGGPRTGSQRSLGPGPARKCATPTGDWLRWLDDPPPEKPPRTVEIRRGPGVSLWGKDADGEGLSAPRVVDRTGANPGPGARRPGRQRNARLAGRATGVAVIVVVAVVVVAVVLVAVRTGNRHTGMSSATASSGVSAAAVDPHAADGCRQNRAGMPVSGIDPGDTASGPGVILAFEHAYYVQRSGAAAAAFLAEGAQAVNRRGVRSPITAERLQRDGIDQIDRGTRYCVRITASSEPDRWHVQLTEQVGHEITSVAQQLITAIASGEGRTSISVIVQ